MIPQELSNISIKVPDNSSESESSLSSIKSIVPKSTSVLDFITNKITKLELSSPIHTSKICSHHEILELLIACYNISLTSGIRSNLHIKNIFYLSQDMTNKNRIL